MNNYIEWVITNPILAFFLLLMEYVLIMIMYYQTRFKALAKAAAIPFIVQDVVVNMIVLSIFFLELPQEWIVTSRLKRWKQIENPSSKRQRVRKQFATTLCNFLNKYDPEHC